MIKLTENLNEYDLSFFENDIFFLRIRSDFDVMSRFENVFFYVCMNQAEITAVISKVSDVITISASEGADFDEINEFVKVVGFTTIICEDKYAHHFEGEKTSGKIMKLKAYDSLESYAEMLNTDDLKKVYRVLKTVFWGKVPDFSDWFVNTCYGVIHNSVMVSGIRSKDELVAVAFALFVTEKTAVISAVATHPEHRNRGYAFEIIKRLLNENKGKEVYLFLEDPLIEEYYAKLGFVPCKMWSEIRNAI
ncbi:MAG: GNAT family N-acetyltransferase [Clostridia bacterium]|nr:GNAT family N-acetyltransferase [Clostridia bacterium]